MAFNIYEHKGTPLDKQVMTWRDLVQTPAAKLNDNTLTRVMIMLMNGIELESIHFSRVFARMNKNLQLPLAQLRRIDQQQSTTINYMIGASLSPIETAVSYEQMAIEVTAAVAQTEPDSYLAQVYRFGLLENFDNMYRFSEILDRLQEKKSKNILQNYINILPSRPMIDEHRAPEDDVLTHYNKNLATPLTKMHALTIMAAEQQAWNYYMNVGPLLSDPATREIYAELAHVKEQHVTQYQSVIDPSETWLEKWLLQKANAVYNYYSCVQQEKDSRIHAIWELFLDYEIGQFHFIKNIFEQIENRDAQLVVPAELPEPLAFKNQTEFVKSILAKEVDLRTKGSARDNIQHRH